MSGQTGPAATDCYCANLRLASAGSVWRVGQFALAAPGSPLNSGLNPIRKDTAARFQFAKTNWDPPPNLPLSLAHGKRHPRIRG